MKAILLNESAQRLYLGHTQEPVPGDDDLLVAVRATALNRADLLQRIGQYPPPPGASDIIGLEMAGVVERAGRHVTGWKAGDRVCALLPGGGYAQKAVIPARMAMAIPDRLSFEEAAAIPEVFLTAYLNLFVLGGLAAGEHVLIHAAASGVGTAAIQLAREAGAIPIATAGSDNKLDVCKSLGAQCLIPYKEQDFADKVLEYTSGRGTEVILDPIGASYWKQNFRCIRSDGRWVLIGGLGGNKVEQLNIASFMSKRVKVIFSTLRSRPYTDKIALTEQFVRFAAEKFASGVLTPVLDKVFDWTEAMAAHEYMANNQNIGKIVLKVQGV
ncbi:NAD(P)H-quinone oxidoreductase [Paenibacillus cymbidii]|uniref:NAD(P)H-quinone oxidoreductase n=1 Tax=Paenibacillus cymbidii TaxID=1639034 RepID=UPI0010808B12|nr:NAD(P)H-quinone oxidoreductase [Paenibacillus cymbidii]